jgi:hypothetical protein
MPVVVATEYFPFVLLDMGGAERTDEDLRRMFAELHAIKVQAMRSETRCVLIATTKKSPSASERKLIAANTNHVSMVERSYTLVTVCIITNPLVRGAVTALCWLVPGLLPTVAFASTGDAAVQIAASHLTQNAVPFKKSAMEGAAAWLRGRVATPSLFPRAHP